ncbi:MAG: FkbM family methyltransferase [Maribacter sp.]|jgi:FkbM family methyltransferase
MLKGKFAYHLSKIAPRNARIKLSLKNGLQFIVRARTMDRAVVKEVWLSNIYDRFGISVEKGDTVIDIGAHIGVFSIYAAEKSQTGKVYAFEPFSDNFKVLEQHKTLNKKNNLFVFNQGVDSKSGTQTLFLSPDNNTGGHSLHLKNNSDKKVEITTITLSNFCHNEQISTIDFLKLDCEGAEFEIIKSSEHILKNVRKIIMECHPYQDNNVDDMADILKRNHFKVNRISNDSPDGIEMIYAVKK